MTVIKNRKYYKWGSTPNVKVIGSPTISNGVGSNFSVTDYFRLPFPFRPGNKTWEIVFKIITPSTLTSSMSVFGNYGRTYQNAPEISISDTSKFYVCIPKDGQTSFIVQNEDSNVTAQANTAYWLKLEFTGTAYIFSYSTDGSNYTQGYSKESSEIIYQAVQGFIIGGNIYDETHDPHFTGTIDLNESYIKVDGSYIWIGMVDECTENQALIYKDENKKYALMHNKVVNEMRLDGGNSTTFNWRSVTHHNNKVVIVGTNGYIATSSTNGVSWKTQQLSTFRNWYDVAYGNNKFIAVGNERYIATSNDGIDWTTTRISASGSYNWGEVIYANGRWFIAGGGCSKCAISIDNGSTWEVQDLPIEACSVTYGNGKFVVVGVKAVSQNGSTVYYSAIITSSDNGQTWSDVILGSESSCQWEDVTYGNGKFVAVGMDISQTSGRVATSTDGITWSNTTTVSDFAVMEEIIYAEGKFIAVGTSASDNNKGIIQYSTDGTAWQNFLTSDVRGAFWGIDYVNGTYHVVGDRNHCIEYVANKDILYSIAYGKDTTYAKNTGIATVPTIYAKNNESRTVLVPNITRVGDLQAASLYKPEIIKGFNANTYATTPTTTFPAETASSWEWNFRFKHKVTGVIQRIYDQNKAYPSGIEIGADDKLCLTMSTSTSSYNIANAIKGSTVLEDGNWYDVKVSFTGTRYLVSSPQLQGVGTTWTFNNVGVTKSLDTKRLNNTFVVIGRSHATNLTSLVNSSGQIATSIDGNNWSTVTISDNGIREITAVSYGNNSYIAIGTNNYSALSFSSVRNYIITSIDGTTWSTGAEVSSLNGFLCTDITYGNGKFVAICRNDYNNRYITTSTDGTTWSVPVQIISNISSFKRIIYGNGVFVAAGAVSYYSTDGLTWNQMDMKVSIVYDVTYGNGKFVAVGTSGYTSTSIDGITWTNRIQANSTVDGLTGIAYGNGTFVTIGSKATTSGDTTTYKSYMTTSTDGITWTAGQQIKTSSTGFIAAGSGIFIAEEDGIIKLAEIVKESSTKIKSTANWKLGYSANRNDGKTAFAGEMDLAHCNIFVDGETWWEGTNGSITVDKNSYDSKKEKIRRFI